MWPFKTKKYVGSILTLDSVTVRIYGTYVETKQFEALEHLPILLTSRSLNFYGRKNYKDEVSPVELDIAISTLLSMQGFNLDDLDCTTGFQHWLDESSVTVRLSKDNLRYVVKFKLEKIFV